MSRAKLSLSLDALGRGSFRVNDIDISNYVTGVSLTAAVGEVTRADISCFGDVEVELEEAEVTIVKADR